MGVVVGAQGSRPTPPPCAPPYALPPPPPLPPDPPPPRPHRGKKTKHTKTPSFTLTDGAKFGGDYLAYPGDPFVYHAQFVVRVLPPSDDEGGSSTLRPTLLKAWARGVHGARKHLLLATAADARELLAVAGGDAAGAPRLRYLTIAKESGFVSSAGPPTAAGQAAPAAGPRGRGSSAGKRGRGGNNRGRR